TNHDEWRLFVAQTDHDSYAADGRRLHSGNQCDPWRAGGSRERDRRRVSGRFVFESERRTRGHRDGRDLRVQRPPRVATAIAVCTDLSVRVQRSECTNAVLASRQLPDRCLPRVGASAHLQLPRDSGPEPGVDDGPGTTLRDHVGYWTQFAHSGDPNSAGAPTWPLYGASDQFQSLHPATPAASTGFATDHKCAFWNIN